MTAYVEETQGKQVFKFTKEQEELEARKWM